MSAHNHDEEIMRRFNTRRGKILQEKAADELDAKISEAVLNCDISGLTRKEAKAKLDLVISAVVESHFG